ncbi:hypothetical protein K461DRAFT_295680 [Myriangium duriaei CBS 260.36]|uniref:DUF7770 domain-containing protein n=1 Tax=Myriangium duriaei CBS 260.36 TaxID=1168546 RepID=A0A9P4IXI7_9PEZI|nr:hypothetical protein K461DRAFT_295680 [Myriangium duriaei CBS 260.36]
MQAVEGVRLVAHGYGARSDPESMGESINHITTFLLFRNGTSVRVDMADVGPIDGQLQLKTKSYHLSDNAAGHVDLVVRGIWTVDDLRQAVPQFGLQTFLFDDRRFGCRYWQLMLIRMLESRSWLVEHSWAMALNFLVQRYQREPALAAPFCISPGSFKSRVTQQWALSNLSDMQQRLRSFLTETQTRLVGLRQSYATTVSQLNEAKRVRDQQGQRRSIEMKVQSLKEEKDRCQRQIDGLEMTINRYNIQLNQLGRTTGEAWALNNARLHMMQ